MIKLDVVWVKGAGFKWALRACASDGRVRFRGFYYKADAVRDKEVWGLPGNMTERNFNHNFEDAETLGIKDYGPQG